MPADRSLERLANSTLLVPFESHTAPAWVLDGLADGFAGVCLFHNNISDTEQVTALNRTLSEAADHPLVSLDEEGGDVTRIGQAAGSEYPGNAALGAIDDPSLTREVHRALGAELRGLGFTLDLAPSVDVNTAADNPVIGTRSFGADPALVVRHAAAAVTGLQQGGVAACAKHFPGHGATHQDSHHELPVIDADVDLLEHRELRPFRAAVAAGVKSVLTAHIQLPSLGLTRPATLTPEIITGLLRDRLGFDGVVVTDALDMRGVSGEIGIPEAAVRALAAGCDLLCLGRFVYADQVALIRSAIVDAARTGRLSGDRLEQAAERITTLRTWTAEPTGTQPRAYVGLDAARRAVRVHGTLPPLDDPYVVELDAPLGVAVGEVPWGLAPWYPGALRLDPERTSAEEVLRGAAGRALLMVVRDAHRYPRTRALVEELCRQRDDVVVVEMGLPIWRPASRALITTHGAARVNGQSAAEVLGSPAPASIR